MSLLSTTPKGTTRYLIATLLISIITVVFIGITLASLRKEAVQTHRHIANLHAHTFDEHFSQILEQVNQDIQALIDIANDQVNGHDVRIDKSKPYSNIW